MKNTIKLFFAAAIGSALTIASFEYIFKEKTEKKAGKSVETIKSNNHLASYVTTSFNSESVDFTEASEKTIDAVVHVKTEFNVPGSHYYFDPFDFFFGEGGYYQEQKPAMATGSGVIISNDGYIVTNNHVIDKAEKIKITLNNKKEYEAKLIGTDPNTDLALLKIDATELPFVSYGNSDKVKVGEWVLAVGNPFNLTSTVTAGIVSAKGRDINILGNNRSGHAPIESFIQTDAAVNPGNSGGALVNTRGELIGINTAIKSNTGSFTGYSFAVPVNIVKKVINDLLEYGIVQRAYIGVSIRDIDAEFAKEKSLNVLEGVYISSTMDDGAAEDAGIKTGDIITDIENVKIKDVPQLQEQLGKYRPGDTIQVNINREGELLSYMVTLRNKNGNTSMEKIDVTELSTLLGADFETLNDQEVQKLRLSGGVKIVNLKSGKLKSAGVKEGFIITKVDKKEINSYQDLALSLKNKKGGVLIEGMYGNGSRSYYGVGIN